MKKEVILLVLISLFIVNVSAFNFEDRLYGLETEPPTVITFNNNTAFVNRSNFANFWDLLDTPDDFGWTRLDDFIQIVGLQTDFNETKLNESIDAKTKSINYNASTINTTAGTLDSGDIDSIHQYKDGDTYNVSESAGANPLAIIINWTGVASFDFVDLRILYEGGQGHEIEVGLYDYTTDTYEEEYIEITDQAEFTTITLHVRDPQDHISNGVVSLRFRHVQNGVPSHNFFIDYANLIEGFSTTTNIEHDSLSGRDNIENHPWACAVDGSRNCSTWNLTYNTHLTSDGSDHIFINQSVTTNSSPLFQTIRLNGSEGHEFEIIGKTGLADISLTLDLLNNPRTLTISGNPQIADWFNQPVKTYSPVTFLSVGLGDYRIDKREGATYSIMSVQGQDSGKQMSFELFTKDGDGTDHSINNIFGKGSISQLTNLEYIQYGWSAAGYFATRVVKAGDGVYRNYTMWSSAQPNQFLLDIEAGGIYMAGVYDDDLGTQRDLLIRSDGRLGYDSSSIAFKENVENMTDEKSSKIYDLRPVTYDKINGSKNQIGLIAEEVNELYPEFISYKREDIWGKCEGQNISNNYSIFYEDCIVSYKLTDIPETVSYKKFVVPLIQEVQNLKAENDLLKDCISNSKDFLELQRCI